MVAADVDPPVRAGFLRRKSVLMGVPPWVSAARDDGAAWRGQSTVARVKVCLAGDVQVAMDR